MIKRLLSMLLSLTVILSLVPPITAAAADEDTGVMTAVSTTVEISEDEAFLWDSTTDRKTLAGINPEWYKANVTDAGIQSITIKIPASTETIRKDFGGSYATIEGYSTAGTKLVPQRLNCQQVLIDFSEATNLKTIGLQAFFQVSGLTGVIDLSNTQVEVIEGNAFKKTAITGVILPTTLKRVGNDNANSSGDASVFGQCTNLAYIRVAGGDSNAVLELPSSLQLIGYTGFLLDGTKIEQTMKTNPFVIKIPASVTEMQHTAIGFEDRTAMRNAQYLFEKTDFTNTNFQNDCLFGLSYTNTWGVARFASKGAYDSFVTKYSDSTKFYGYPTYEFDLTFKDKETQPKLWGQSIQYEKNDATNYWTLNKSYALPTAPTGQEPAAGQVGYWELNGDELKADSKLPATPVETELTAVWTVIDKLAEPTIAYTLNGKVQGNLSDGTPVLLKVPYVNGNPGKIGVKAVHPLLKPEEGGNGTDDNYVYFKYRWIDVKSAQVGPRSQTIADDSGFYNRTTRTAPDAKYNEVEIRDSNDNRVKMSGAWGPYTFYNCEIYGYHVQNGVEKLFYASNAFGSFSLSFGDDPGLTRTTDEVFYIQAKYIDTWTVTFDPNGGTAPTGADYSPRQVEKSKGISIPYEPQKEGYTSCWKKADGTGEYYGNDYFTPDSDVTLVAQYEPIEYTINYVPNLTGATGTVGPQTYEYDTADFKLTTDTFTSTTKDFRGWSLTADATTATYASGAAIDDALKAAMTASPDETVTLYAVWKDKTTHTVTFNAGTNGSFANTSDPLINQTVIEGLSVTGVPAVTASGRYRFDGWKLDGDTSGKVYTNDEVKAMVINGNMTFTASYTYVGGSSGGGSGSVSSYIIKATAGANGSISPNGTISVSRGANKTFSIKANAGYEIVDVLVDGTSVGAVRTYEFKNVTKAHEIYATFKKTENEPEQEVADPEKTGVAGLLETVKHDAYLHGYGNGEFGPNNNMTRAEAAQMFYNLLREKNVTVTVRFTDVPDDAWYATAVNTLASLGILKGVGEDKYDPTRAISRAEFAAIATRFAKVNLEGSTPFDDVSDADWYYNAVLTAVNYGWINGYGDNTFRPYNTVTRAEVTTIVNRMLARRADKDFVADHINNMRTFNDVDSSFWAYHYIMEATNGHDYDRVEHTEIWKSHTAQ
mgnify:CR=1 FL=1